MQHCLPYRDVIEQQLCRPDAGLYRYGYFWREGEKGYPTADSDTGIRSHRANLMLVFLREPSGKAQGRSSLAHR